MTEKLIRLLRILQAIQANPGISAKELALKCGTTVRTIYRDLRILDRVAPIMNEGYGKGYRFIGEFAMYPLDFTEQEAMVFSMLPSVVDTSQLPAEFDSAFDKVMTAHTKMKSRNSDIVENIAGIIRMGTPAYREEGKYPNLLIPVIEAILDQQTIRTQYHTLTKNEITVRDIDPYYLIPRDQRFYLIGYCHLLKKVRLFRISRFLDVIQTNTHFVMGDFNITQFMKNTWSIDRGDKLIHFKVRFSKEVAPYIKEEEMFVRPRMTDLPDGGLLFEVTLNSSREFLKWLYQFGPEAEVLEPREYRKEIRKQLIEWMKHYAEDQ
ncbi:MULTISPECIES: helix-turn-helix transcriptional regulator [Paenibacillus]|uniref:helix-turn-helix transcriptional regulator n=1 Tax=Paenibacillus TaxID=44249 RepID=UPI000885193F|nr:MULTISPECIES: transcriptional regulator [Paenibacillus]MCZ1265102.1 transcriptional regulator [Paenibacillus tundrae]SDL56494.1 Predicted DNA-binding transcriptional regulator YafY, contains an HTH and WYL domains [Paenibacillus sp. OK060]SEB22815.1 Predicted DNA-binding transcriptional regulator YafY, contains an HTH and WYL domains [Paenibacillus sp. 276b]SLK20541.1 Predicted DNA-binding transcriptional regulator YafY, contains an HTH and WYL domains [Paenibacillus sp. RU5A]SOC76199.1 Pre